MKNRNRLIEERISELQRKHHLSSVGINILKAQLFAGAKEDKALQVAKEFESPVLLTTPQYKTSELLSSSLQCKRCGSLMSIVTLSDNRKVKYCSRDSVVVPFPKEESYDVTVNRL